MSNDRTQVTVARLLAGTSSLDATSLHAARIGHGDAFRYGWSGPSAGFAGGWLARLLTRLTGIERATPFADRRLEALRLFVCMVRRDDRRMTAMADELVGLGYSRAGLRQAMQIALT